MDNREDRPESIEEFRARSKNREGMFDRYGMTEQEKNYYRREVPLIMRSAGRRHVRNQMEIEFIMQWWPAGLIGLLGIALCKLLSLDLEYCIIAFPLGCTLGIFVKNWLADRRPLGEAFRSSMIPMTIGIVFTLIIGAAVKSQL